MCINNINLFLVKNMLWNAKVQKLQKFRIISVWLWPPKSFPVWFQIFIYNFNRIGCLDLRELVICLAIANLGCSLIKWPEAIFLLTMLHLRGLLPWLSMQCLVRIVVVLGFIQFPLPNNCFSRWYFVILPRYSTCIHFECHRSIFLCRGETNYCHQSNVGKETEFLKVYFLGKGRGGLFS